MKDFNWAVCFICGLIFLIGFAGFTIGGAMLMPAANAATSTLGLLSFLTGLGLFGASIQAFKVAERL